MMFFHRKTQRQDEEVSQAMSDHDEAMRRFQESMRKAEAAHAADVLKLLQGLVPTHTKGSKQ